MKAISLTLIFSFLFLVVNAQLTQWRGQNRDGIFNEEHLLTSWPENGPEQILKVSGIGAGWSSPVVTNDRIFITGKMDDRDVLSCLDLDGKAIWQKPYGSSWQKSYPDTRGSATIEDDRVYVISGMGELSCFNKETGDLNWYVNVDSVYESEWHNWGVSESPLIVDDLVICTPGGNKTSVVALDKITGKERWKTKSLGGQRAYASPEIYEHNGKRMILAVIATHLMAVDPMDGGILWSFKYFDPEKWKFQPGLIWINTPVFKDNRIFLSMGYDYDAVMLEVNEQGDGVSEVYRNRVLDNHHHGLILLDGFVYGSNWLNNGKGKWACMRWSDGEIMWEYDWYNKGSLIFADGMLYAYEEKSGHVGLIKPDPSGFHLVSEFKVEEGSGPHWAHPFIAHGNLYLRHGDVLMAYGIAETDR